MDSPVSGSEQGAGSRGVALSKVPAQQESVAIEAGVSACTHVGIPCPGLCSPLGW